MTLSAISPTTFNYETISFHASRYRTSFFATDISAHPGSGIVVDRLGNIYFIDTGAGVWKIDTSGNVTKLPGPAYHWMAIDVDNRLANVTLPYFSSDAATVTRVGTSPTLFVSSDFPLTVGGDGKLYYPWNRDGKYHVFRLTPSGTTTVFKTLAAGEGNNELRWLNGIAAASDGSIYYTEDRSIKRISPQGELTTVADNLALPDCIPVPGIEKEVGLYLRGLDVDSQGAVYVAASGCGAVMKVTPDKKVTAVLRASGPWSPTAVAVYGNDLYVLEYFHTVNENRREWVPRVRKVSGDGKIVTVATIDRSK